MDFNIIIAHRGDPLGLWATIHSCEADLVGSSFNYTYIIVENGTEHRAAEDLNLQHFMQKTGKLGSYIVHPEPLSPPSARQLGTVDADGKLLFFFDNHCLVGRDYFRRAVADFEHYGMDMLHSTTVFYTGNEFHYHYKLTLAKNFWAESSQLPQHNLKPYRIAAGGHGGFVVRRDVWQEVGGYWDGFQGYGGEEIYFDLKMALLDKTNWIDPRVVHYHYTGSRGYKRHYSADYFRNMLMCANIIGGERWMNKVALSFYKRYTRFTRSSIYDILQDAYAKSRDHAADLASRRKRTLDEQLRLFSEQCIAFD